MIGQDDIDVWLPLLVDELFGMLFGDSSN